MNASPTNEQRRYQEWCDEVRQKIDAGWEQAASDQLVDGEEAFKRLKAMLEARRKPQQ